MMKDLLRAISAGRAVQRPDFRDGSENQAVLDAGRPVSGQPAMDGARA